MADQTLKILIDLGVVGADDAKAAEQLLAETAEAANKTAEAIENLAQSANKNTAANKASTEAIEPNVAALQEVAAIAGELANGDYSKMPESVVKLANQMGLLGEMLSPVGIGLMGVGAAAYFVYEHFKEVDARLAMLADHWRDFDDIIGDLEGINARNAAIDDMIGKTDSLASSTQKVSTATKDLSDDTDDLNLTEKIKLQYLQEELKKEEEVAIAKVNARRATGEITAEEANKEIGSIRGQFSELSRFETSKSEQREIDSYKDELAKQKNIAGDLGKKQISNSAAVTGADLDATEKKKQWESAKADVEKETKWLHDHDSKLSPDEDEKERAKLHLLDMRAIQAGDKYDQSVKHANSVRGQAQTDKSQLEEANRRIDDLNKKITRLETNHTLAQKHRDNMAGFEHQQNGVAAHSAQFNSILEKKDSTGQSIDSMAKAMHLSQQETAKIVERIIGHQSNYQQVITSMHARIDQLENQSRSSGFNHR